ncbi:MAG: CPBP family intramembrane metalloprotease [Candidatus Aminicenantes bacterium]|nr:CPBP family intramembrane metalloprotease [Candidatus Aminicenantes bacterium]
MTEANKENEGLACGNAHRRRYSLRMLATFFALAFAITWGILVPALAAVPEKSQIFFIILAAFGPLLAAVIAMRAFGGRDGLRSWLRRTLRPRLPVMLYLAGAFLLPIAIGALHFGLYRILGGRPDFSGATPWPLYLAYLVPTALLTGGNEEPGWRGFALPALLERMHPAVATLVLGVIHALWHLPLMARYDTTFAWYLFNILPLTVILNWIYLRSRGSVLPVMLLHAGVNVIGSFLPSPSDVLGGLGTFVALRGAVYWVLAIVILAATRGRLGHGASSGPERGRIATKGRFRPKPGLHSAAWERKRS